MSAIARLERAEAAGEGFTGIAIVLGVESENWLAAGLGDIEALARRCLVAAADAARLPADIETEIGLTLTDDARIRTLNAQWRGKDKPTNVLSFPLLRLDPGDRPGPMLGDLVLALETLEREARAEGKTLHDHFSHLIVHGMLHCLGFDHETVEDAAAMEALETAILASLGIADPYRETEPEEEPIRA